MFRELKRKERSISIEESKELLNSSQYGFLSTLNPDGFPYCIAMSFVFFNDKIYLHHTKKESALSENISRNNKVCFSLVEDTLLLPEKFSTLYKSVVVFGTVKEITDEAFKKNILNSIIDKYSKAYKKEGYSYVEKAHDKTMVLEITPIRITGKARKE